MDAISNRFGVKALLFDVFGTVVDWRGSIIREGNEWGPAQGLRVDWALFADRWREGYRPSMDRVRNGAMPWTNLDGLHRLVLGELLKEFHIDQLSFEQQEHLNEIWHRLDPWPDSVPGLTRMKKGLVIATLSNGNVSLLVEMARHAGLPWDMVISAELFRRYKPDRDVYLESVKLLGCRPAEAMMVAAHPSDLVAARDCGMKTAFVMRPLEYGGVKLESRAAQESFDITARDFLDLAERFHL